jgi:hypothetical protein
MGEEGSTADGWHALRPGNLVRTAKGKNAGCSGDEIATRDGVGLYRGKTACYASLPYRHPIFSCHLTGGRATERWPAPGGWASDREPAKRVCARSRGDRRVAENPLHSRNHQPSLGVAIVYWRVELWDTCKSANHGSKDPPLQRTPAGSPSTVTRLRNKPAIQNWRRGPEVRGQRYEPAFVRIEGTPC